MSTVVQYRVKPEYAAENRRLIEDVFAELHEIQPDGLAYASYVQEDGVSFVHVVTNEPDSQGILPTLPAFQRFQKGIADRCEVQPERFAYTQVGAYSAELASVTAASAD
jgi:hypothetical protein